MGSHHRTKHCKKDCKSESKSCRVDCKKKRCDAKPCDKPCKKEVKPCHKVIQKNADCNRQCCTKIAWIDVESDAGLQQVRPYLDKLVDIYFPVEDIQYAFIEAIPARPDCSETNAELIAWVQEFLKPTYDIVEKFVQEHCDDCFEYIGLPSQSTFLSPYLLGYIEVLDSEGEVCFHFALDPQERPISQRFPHCQFMVANPGTGTVDQVANVTRFNDVNTSNDTTIIVGNVRDIFGFDPLDNTQKIALPTQLGDAVSEEILDAVIDALINASPDPFLAANIITPDGRNGTTADPSLTLVFNGTDFSESGTAGEGLGPVGTDDTVANNIEDLYTAGATRVLVGVIANGNLSDEFSITANNQDFWDVVRADPTVTNPALNSLVYWGANYSPVTETVPVNIYLGLAAVAGLPSSVQSGLGLSDNIFIYAQQILTVNPAYIMAVAWAANCRKVAQDVIGIPFKIFPGTNTLVSFWLQNTFIGANTLDIREANTGFQVNGRWYGDDAIPQSP